MMNDIVIKGRPYKKEEELRYYPHLAPNERMLWCTVFYNLWRCEKNLPRHHKTWWAFMKYFNKLYSERKKTRKCITWDDFKNLDIQPSIKAPQSIHMLLKPSFHVIGCLALARSS